MEIPYTSDLLLQSIMNRDLVDRHPETLKTSPQKVPKSQEPVYGFRSASRPIRLCDALIAAELVDDVFSSQVRDTVTKLGEDD